MVVMSTTNGTKAAHAAARTAKHVLLASLYNAHAAARLARELATEEVAILCAGKEGRAGLDDLYTAGVLAEYLGFLGEVEPEDGARVALAVKRAYPDPLEALSSPPPPWPSSRWARGRRPLLRPGGQKRRRPRPPGPGGRGPHLQAGLSLQAPQKLPTGEALLVGLAGGEAGVEAQAEEDGVQFRRQGHGERQGEVGEGQGLGLGGEDEEGHSPGLEALQGGDEAGQDPVPPHQDQEGRPAGKAPRGRPPPRRGGPPP